MTTAVLILAAGAGSRFHGPTHKLLAPLDDLPVVAHALVHAAAADLGPLVVVTGAVDIDPSIWGVTATVTHNPRWAEGQATSLHAGFRTADELGADRAVIGLGDQPFVETESWRRVARAPQEWPIVVASYAGRRGPHPVRIDRSLWASVPPVGDDGARQLLLEHGDLVHVVACTGSAHDIDTWEDVQQWKSS
jgi:molybdenum cofactor cytidylyltransferase